MKESSGSDTDYTLLIAWKLMKKYFLSPTNPSVFSCYSASHFDWHSKMLKLASSIYFFRYYFPLLLRNSFQQLAAATLNVKLMFILLFCRNRMRVISVSARRWEVTRYEHSRPITFNEELVINGFCFAVKVLFLVIFELPFENSQERAHSSS